MTEKIIEALKALDPANDEHWTADGAPKIDALGLDGVKRQDIVKAAPHFTRSNPKFETPAQAEVRKAVEVEQKTKLSAIEAASKKIDDVNTLLETLDKKRRDNLLEIQKALADRDAAERELRDLQGPHNEQRTIMDYLASIKREKEFLTMPKE